MGLLARIFLRGNPLADIDLSKAKDIKPTRRDMANSIGYATAHVQNSPLKEGETLWQWMKRTVSSAIENMKMQQKFEELNNKPTQNQFKK